MIIEEIKKILDSQLGIPSDDVDENTDIASDLGADSIDMVEMMLELETIFNIKFDDIDASGIKTIGDVVALVEKLKG